MLFGTRSRYSACLPRLKLPNLPIIQPPMQIVMFGGISLYRYVTSAYSPSSTISTAVNIMSGLFFFPRSIYSCRSAGEMSPPMTVISMFSIDFQLRSRSIDDLYDYIIYVEESQTFQMLAQTFIENFVNNTEIVYFL